MIGWINRGLQVLLKEGPLQLQRKLWSRLSKRFQHEVADAHQRAQIPTMLSLCEQLYLYHYAIDKYRGSGAIVDLGCWLGGSTAPLVQGLIRNRQGASSRRVVDSYDQFLWDAWMIQRYRDTPLGHLRIGDSFLPEYENNISSWLDRVRIHAGDLNKMCWIDGPIECLFIDAMKSWDLANSVVRHFYPFLRGGLSTVIHQDFVHWNTPWIILLSFRFRDWLKPIHWVPNSPTYVFECVSQPKDDVFEQGYHFNSFSSEEVEEAFVFFRELLPISDFRYNIIAAHITYNIYCGNLEQAKGALDNIDAQGWPPQCELKHVAPRLHQVEVLRHLLHSKEPLSATDIASRSFLDKDSVVLTLAKLEETRKAERYNRNENAYSATKVARDWIDRSFDKSCLLGPNSTEFARPAD